MSEFSYYNLRSFSVVFCLCFKLTVIGTDPSCWNQGRSGSLRCSENVSPASVTSYITSLNTTLTVMKLMLAGTQEEARGVHVSASSSESHLWRAVGEEEGNTALQASPSFMKSPCAQADARPQSRLWILSPLPTTKCLVPKHLKAHNSMKSLWTSLVPFDVISFIKPKLRPGHCFLDDGHVKYCNHHLCSSTD